MDHWRLDRWLAYWFVGTATTVITIPLLLWVWRDGEAGFYRYQTGISALVAMCAALIAYRSMLSQRRNADRQLEDARKAREDAQDRKRLASVAALPVALADVTGYAESCTRLLTEVHPIKFFQDCDFRPEWPEGQLPPPLPSGATIGTIKECVEFAPSPVALALAKLLQTLQVQHSRLEGLHADMTGRSTLEVVVVAHTIQSHLYDALELHLMGSRLFYYARGETLEAPPPVDLPGMVSTAHINGLREPAYDGLHQLIALRLKEAGPA